MLSDNEIITKLHAFEDQFVERKTASDSSDWLKTAVGFANSCPVGYPGLLLIGVRNDGTIEGSHINLDSLQRTLNRELNKAYPPIYRYSKAVQYEHGEFLAVIVPGSADRPHFSGPAYVRRGSETVQASDEQFRSLVAQRSSKAYELVRHMGEAVTIERRNVERVNVMGEVASTSQATITDCSQFAVTLRIAGSPGSDFVAPLSRVLISRDENGRLKLEIYPVPVP